MGHKRLMDVSLLIARDRPRLGGRSSAADEPRVGDAGGRMPSQNSSARRSRPTRPPGLNQR